jgi:hypothetical protein
MTPGAKFWAAFAATGVAVELVGFATQRQDWMFSPHGRQWLRTDTPVGRACTTVGIGAGATWLAHHLITLDT